jgi:sigma-B regulation protein RsbU (phosphoserine phosphatase)
MAHVLGELSTLSLLSEIKILKSIIYNLAEGIIVADLNGRFLFFNRAAEAILGIGPEDISLQAWSAVYGCYRPDRITPYPAHELPLARALKGETTEETEIFIRNAERPAGIHILVKGSPLLNDENELCGGIVVVRDITRRKQSEQRIQTLTNAVEQTADSIVITNTRGVIEYVNPAFEMTTGYAREETLGRSPSMLKSGVHDALFYRNLWETINAGRVFRSTIANRKKNGEIYFAEQTITPMRDASGTITHFVSVVKDVTEQRKLQEQEFQMRLARSVQQQFYRVSAPQINGFDIAGASFPADATGGDYFDFVPLPGGRIGIAAGDVSGHGISSALLMVELRACLRAFAWKSPNLGEVFTLLNNALVTDHQKESYATLVFCRLNPAARSLAYANAGHLPGYILAADGALKRSLDATDIPLGMFSGRSFTCSEEIRLEPGELLALITDGITEAERPDQTGFGTSNALAFIQAHRQESAHQIAEGLYHAVRDFSDGMPQADDITAVICKSTQSTFRTRKRRTRAPVDLPVKSDHE